MTKITGVILGSDAWRFPGAAVRGLVIGALIGIFSWGGVAGAMHMRYPAFRPALKLTETRILQGGDLIFYAAPFAITRACPEETRRTIFRLMDPRNVDGPRITTVLNDWSALTRGAPPGSLITVSLPQNLTPGAWYYQRITWMWCTPWNWISGPDYFETKPLLFEVVAR